MSQLVALIYDVRNKRDVAHLGDGIDPNQQDATMVVRNMERVLAGLVRLYHNVSATAGRGAEHPASSRLKRSAGLHAGRPS